MLRNCRIFSAPLWSFPWPAWRSPPPLPPPRSPGPAPPSGADLTNGPTPTRKPPATRSITSPSVPAADQTDHRQDRRFPAPPTCRPAGGAGKGRHDAVSHGDRRCRAGGQPRVKPGELKFTGAVPPTSTWQGQQVERQGHRRTQPPDGAARQRHRRGPRADGSGTTFIWTNYLAKVSPEWKQKVGEGTADAVAHRNGRKTTRVSPPSSSAFRRPSATSSTPRQTEQDDLRPGAERRRQFRRPRRPHLHTAPPAPIGASRPSTKSSPARRAGRLADFRRHVHSLAQGPGPAGTGPR